MLQTTQFHCFADAIDENCKELSLCCISSVVLNLCVPKCKILTWMKNNKHGEDHALIITMIRINAGVIMDIESLMHSTFDQYDAVLVG